MKTQVGTFTLLKSLGKGSFGEVYLTQKAGRNGFFATKKIDLTLMLVDDNLMCSFKVLKPLSDCDNPPEGE